MRKVIRELLLSTPTERLLEIAAKENIEIKYEPLTNDYYGKYYLPSKGSVVTEVTMPTYADVKLALVNTIMSKLKKEND